MPDYIVSWEIDAEDAANPVEAARHALAMMPHAEASEAMCFTVTDCSTGKRVQVDLSSYSFGVWPI